MKAVIYRETSTGCLELVVTGDISRTYARPCVENLDAGAFDLTAEEVEQAEEAILWAAHEGVLA